MAESVDAIQPYYQLYPYQRQVLQDLLTLLIPSNLPQFGPGRRAIAHMPTGAGKTRLACHAACHLFNKYENEDKLLIWLAASEELCEQAADSLAEAWLHLGNRTAQVHRYWGDTGKLSYEPGFLVTGLAKLYAASGNDPGILTQLARRAAAVVFDEAHQAIARTYQFVTEQLLTFEPPLLGLTATPGRKTLPGDEDERLAELFNHQKVTINPRGHPDPLTYLITHGFLSDPQFTLIPLSSNLPFLEGHGGDYPDSVLNQIGKDPDWQEQIVRVTTQALSEHRRVIVFCPSLESVHECTAELGQQELQVASITGTTPTEQRQNTIRKFREPDDNPMALLNYGVLTAGFDAPRTSCVIIARPTTSLVLYSQMAGRAMRGERSGGNRRCQIYTVVDTKLPGFGSVAEAFQNWEELWQPL